MSKITDSSEPANELERLIADLSASGPLIFVFGDGFTTGHLTGATTPVFRGPAEQRWWHVELGDDAAKWVMDVRVDEITGVQFVRAPYPFQPHFPGHEVLTVQFLGARRGHRPPLLRGRPVPRSANAPGETGGLASTARTLRQPRRVEGRSRRPPGPGRLNHRDHRHAERVRPCPLRARSRGKPWTLVVTRGQWACPLTWVLPAQRRASRSLPSWS
jgi:hypothetical protein